MEQLDAKLGGRPQTTLAHSEAQPSHEQSMSINTERTKTVSPNKGLGKSVAKNLNFYKMPLRLSGLKKKKPTKGQLFSE